MYENVVKQIEIIFELGFLFASGLLRAIKKDKSWPLVSWSESKMNQLLALVLHHIKADWIRRNCWKEAFKTIN